MVSLETSALELARALGWMGGALYLVDLVGGRLHRWRLERAFWKDVGPSSVYPGSGTRTPVRGVPGPVSSRTPISIPSSPPAGGRPPRPVE